MRGGGALGLLLLQPLPDSAEARVYGLNRTQLFETELVEAGLVERQYETL